MNALFIAVLLMTPLWRCAMESRPVTMVAWHFAAHLLLAQLLPARIKRFVMALVYPDPMEGTPEGLTDKLYWRKARGEWHCFKKIPQVRGYVSLCERREIALVLGQQISRPEAHLRCGLCDEVEMTLRGWEGSGPVSPRRAGSFSR